MFARILLLGCTFFFHFPRLAQLIINCTSTCNVSILKKRKNTKWALPHDHISTSSRLFTWGLVQESAQFMIGRIQEDKAILFRNLIYAFYRIHLMPYNYVSNHSYILEAKGKKQEATTDLKIPHLLCLVWKHLPIKSNL